MKMVHLELQNQIVFGNDSVCEWIIESPAAFASYMQELYVQTEGGEGRFVLSDNEKEIDISKAVEIIMNPLTVNINDKKILSKLYSELEDLAYGEENYLRTQEVIGKLQSYFYELEQSSTYMMGINENIDVLGIFKLLGIKLECYDGDFFSQLNQYIKVLAELLRKKLVVLINIRSYASEEQVLQLIEMAMYYEIKLLLVENCQRKSTRTLRRYILDEDQCEI